MLGMGKDNSTTKNVEKSKRILCQGKLKRQQLHQQGKEI